MNKLPLLEARLSSATGIDTNICAVFQDSAKKAISPKGAYSPAVEKLRKAGAFDAKHGAIQFLRFFDSGSSKVADNALLIGMGPSAELTEEKSRLAGGTVWAKLNAEKCKEVSVEVDSFVAASGIKEADRARLMRAFAEGLVLSAYQFNKYKTKSEAKSEGKLGLKSEKGNNPPGPSQIVFVTQDKNLKSQLELELIQVTAIGEAVGVTRDWSNEPSNYGTPVYYANEAKRLAKQYGLKCKILTEQDAEREKMGLFLGVGQGAERESRIVVLEYSPKGVKNPKTVALVGKGVTFDSGGISIKPSMKMEDMKHDMTGAATVMGAMLLASSWEVPNRVVAVMAFCENMPDGNAIQPGNVLTSRSGKTVEIINTDAEGRLVLADVLDYAQDLKPDAIVDVATLTGAVSIALGKHCCGILGNDEALISAVRRAGEANGERIWELPLYDEYFDDLKSDYADMKNSANDSLGGTIRGAVFLKQFIRKGSMWAHLDIAATAWNLGHLSYYPKRGASGAYVRTLAQFIANF
ncbi:MAG: leucyl aminopeptidase [Bdellovibrionia bacterium]